MLSIKSVEFAGAIARPGQAVPGELRQIAFSGRSNVGKSSLINRLLGRTRTHVARVSSTPGKTQEINFFRVRYILEGADADFFLVDLPGYGYARVPHAVRDRWKPLIESYLTSNEALVGVVQLLDARRGATNDDLQMVEFLAHLGVPTLFVLTKIDKLKRSERARQTAALRKDLALEPEQVVVFSAKTGEGRDELLGAVGQLLESGDGTG